MRRPAFRGLVQPSEGRRLAELAAGVRPEQAIVELGSHTGLSTCWMAAATRAHVTAIDPWGPPRPGSQDDPFGLEDRAYETFMANVAGEGLAGRITPLRARSTDVAPFWAQPIGLLFIDAVHEYWAVRDDYLAWSPFIAVDGWLTFHDYTEEPGHAYEGVAAAIAEFVVPSGLWSDPIVTENLWTARRLTSG